MIWFDTTKSAAAGHRSGLMRVSTRLLEELGNSASPVRWPVSSDEPSSGDWYLTTELFSEPERPGFTAFVGRRKARMAAVFHDAIPLKHPQITWPQSVARHPAYMKLLAGFDRVWAVSHASRDELQGFWKWQGLVKTPAVDVLPLGSDFNRTARVGFRAADSGVPILLCIGILEPRKNQGFLLDVCENLWREGLRFELHLVGRVNPHFGAPVLARVRTASRSHRGAVVFHESIDDDALAALYARARATVFPTIAEGCGLPLLESLWMGVPCVCSDLPVLRENAEGGGCLPVRVNEFEAWVSALRHVLSNDDLVRRLAGEAVTRALPTWSETAAVIRTGLAS